jgi:D-proline reductase (dithiol) PrdB
MTSPNRGHGDSADARIRAQVAGLGPDIQFEPATPTVAPPLAEARVALVTTAALMNPGEPWAANAHEFRAFEVDELDHVIVGHNSTNFDRSGFIVDRNVVFPIDRLREMEARGTIGAVAPRHLAFLGSTFDLGPFVLDTGPAAAELLIDDDVDVVLLTPV